MARGPKKPFDCAGHIKNLHGLSDTDAKEIIKSLREILKANRAEANMEAVVKRIASEMAGTAKREAALKVWRAKLQIMANSKVLRRLSSFDDPSRGYESYLVGNDEFAFGALDSIDARQKAMRGKLLGPMKTELEAGHEGILNLMGEKNFDLDIGREMEALSSKKPRATGNDNAFHVARVFEKYKDIITTELNKLGADRARLSGHVWKQLHDGALMLKAGPEKWIADITPLLDIDRSFGPAGARADVNKVLTDIYNSRTSGISSRAAIEGPPTRPSNLANKLSQNRVLHFKDFEASYKYDQIYSKRGLGEAVIARFESDIEDLVMLERMGPNPDAQHAKQIDRIKGQLKRRGDPKAVRKLATLENQWAAISGKDRIVGDPNAADFMNWARAIQQWSKLGGSTLSSFNDLFTNAAMLNYNGVNFLTAYGDMFTGIGPNPKGEKLAAVRALGIYSEGMMGQIAGRFTVSDGIPGASAKITNLFYKLNLLNWWTNANKNAFGLSLSGLAADQLHFKHADLDVSMRDQLNRYGIGKADWETLRAASPELQDVNGRKLLTPDSVEKLPAFKGRDEIAQKLRMWYVNEADFGTPTPGAKERGFMLRGTQPGTVYGEFARSMWQFKAFPLTIMTKVWPRLARQGVPGYIHLFAGSVLFGYAAMTAKDLVKGREPRDVADGRTWVSAALQGGGAGILGDLIFNDFNQFGRSFPEVVLGPVAGTAGDFLRVFSSIMRLEGQAAAAKFFRGAMNNMPFANLFYLRAAVDYFGVYLLQESVNPGYLERMERRMEENNGQGFMVNPSSVIPHGGPFR